MYCQNTFFFFPQSSFLEALRQFLLICKDVRTQSTVVTTFEVMVVFH